MIPYILYTALILSASLIFYKLLLQKETFFQMNRLFLIACMVIAFILPVIHIPQQMSFRNAITEVHTNNIEILTNQNPGNNADNKMHATVDVPLKSNNTINLDKAKQWIMFLYWFGVAIFGLNFLMQAILLLYKAWSRPTIKDGKFRIVEITGDKAPCSFGNNIFINPEKYDWETYNQVLLHEKIHIEQKHTIDLILAEIVIVFQWFNPFAWQWRKELENNLEYFTDDKLLQYDAIKKESYQLSLLKVAAPHFPLSLTTNYNQSLLKKRLLMMNAKKSNMHTAWKYFFLLPLMVLFASLFNEPIVKSQTATPKPIVKANPKVETEIKTEGNWFATIKGDKINFQFKNDDDKSSYNGNSFLLSEFSNLPRDKRGTFTLAREAGIMEFTGKFDGDKGMGEYKFTPDKGYSGLMNKEGIELKDEWRCNVFLFCKRKTILCTNAKAAGLYRPGQG